MKASLLVDGESIALNPFVGNYLANVCKAILDSLKGTEGTKRAVFDIEGKTADLKADGVDVDLHASKGFAGVIVRDTLLGVLAHLRGVRKWNHIRIEFQA